MVTLQPTAEQIDRARAAAATMGILPGSFTHGRGNLSGMLGEVVSVDYLGAKWVRPPIYSHDMELSGVSYDIKTKTGSSIPLPEYTASVAAKKGEIPILARRLLFVRMTPDLNTVWLLGWMSLREFRKQAEFIKIGTREGGFIHRVDGFHIPIGKLKPVDELLR